MFLISTTLIGLTAFGCILKATLDHFREEMGTRD